jgi:uncharacterized protein (DUF362 family)
MVDGASSVGLVSVDGGYPADAPFNPDESYPEYGTRPISAAPNPVYRAVRNLLYRLGYDRARYGSPMWNPLGHLIAPGDRVFIKPNLVTHEVRKACACQGHLFAIITHASVVRAVADYAAIALGGRGEIVIGDNPSIDADFDAILARTGLDAVGRIYPRQFSVRCRVLDLRPLRTPDLSGYGYRSRTVEQPGDPEGSTILNLGAGSRFHGMDPSRFRGVFSDRRETIRHHSGDRQEYSISNTILNADVFISVPKLKAHHKVGATLNIKGLVGINSNKNLLPHWQQGYGTAGGDEFPTEHRPLDGLRLTLEHALEDALPERWYLGLRRLVPSAVTRLTARRALHSHERYRGAWDGNDTCWRMAADLYDVFVLDKTRWRQRHGRHPLRFFSVIDGVLAGEADGPFCPSPRETRVVFGGEDLLLTDAVAARYMDFDLSEIRYLAFLLERAAMDLTTIGIETNVEGFAQAFHTQAAFGRFRAPEGWPRLSTAVGHTTESAA